MLSAQAFRRKADSNGWTNWDTWNTALMIDNNWPHENSNQEANELVKSGGSVEQLADWALRYIVGPHNKEIMDEAQQWTDEEEVAAKQERDLEEWMRRAQELYPDDPDARMNYVEKMRNLIYGLMGSPEPTDISNHIIEDSKINWQEIYDSIVNDIEENQRYERQQEEQLTQQDTIENLGEASDFLWG